MRNIIYENLCLTSKHALANYNTMKKATEVPAGVMYLLYDNAPTNRVMSVLQFFACYSTYTLESPGIKRSHTFTINMLNVNELSLRTGAISQTSVVFSDVGLPG